MPSKIRILEHRVVKGRDLVNHPRNPKIHTARQKEVIGEILSTIGYISELPCVDTPEGPMLIDGHLRKGLSENDDVPIAITDLSESEALVMLAAYDASGDLQEIDEASFAPLLQEVSGYLEQSEGEFPSLQGLLNDLQPTAAEPAAPAEPKASTPKEPKEPELKSEVYVELHCSLKQFDKFKQTLNRWSEQEGVTVNVTQ